MSTLFLVGDATQEDSLSANFTLTLRKRSVKDLVTQLYVDRHTQSNDYETDLSVVCYKATGASALDSLSASELQEMLQQHFPCFNLTVVESAAGATAILKELQRLRIVCRDRLSRMSNWMFSQNQTCSVNIYSMARHLSTLKSMPVVATVSGTTGSTNGFPSLLTEAIDFKSLLSIPHDDRHYLSLLDTWNFCAHSLNTQELIWCSYLIIRKVIDQGSLSISSIHDNNIFLLLFTLEASYHQGNKFHNFRHAMDVMQATYQLCCLLSSSIPSKEHILLLCMAAIGHDVGHPGTNNALLCNHSSPIAQACENKSVLENFHTKIFTNMLQAQWPDLLRPTQLSDNNLVISESILATDMARHSEYVDKLNLLPARSSTLTSLIVKAADISNVTRPLEISAKWAVLITNEFNECAMLEKRLSEPDQKPLPTLPDSNVDFPPTVEDIIKMYPMIPKGQLFFINTFAENLFAGLGKKFEQLNFLNENIKRNKQFWLEKS